MRRVFRFRFAVGLSLAFMMSPGLSMAETDFVNLDVKVVHATKSGKTIDPALKQFAKDFEGLKFTSFKLKDSLPLRLNLGSTGRIQLPNGVWMNLTAVALDPKGLLRLRIDSKTLRFKAAVTVASGATVAVGGPPYKAGALIFAITRLQKTKKKSTP